MSYNIRNLPPLYVTPQLLYGTRKRDFPFDYDPTHFIVEEKYLVKLANYSQQARNTPNSLYPTAFLVDENIDRQEQDGVWFTRHYATIPANWYEYPQESIIPPALYGIRLLPQAAQPVTSKMTREYFMVGTGGSYATVDDIPIIRQTRLLVAYGSPIISYIDIGPILGGGFDYLLPGAYQKTTSPDVASDVLSAYAGWIGADAATSSSYSIITQASKPEQYKGNIWKREYTKTKAR